MSDDTQPVDPNADWSKVMGDIEHRLRQYVPGQFHWTSIQTSKEFDDLYGICIGEGVACVRLSVARNADDALIRELATQILGYPPDSRQDLETRLQDARTRIRNSKAVIATAKEHISIWESHEQDIMELLKALGDSDVEFKSAINAS